VNSLEFFVFFIKKSSVTEDFFNDTLENSDRETFMAPKGTMMEMENQPI
jgi:hypothetical protein